jgi:hypothetical protein
MNEFERIAVAIVLTSVTLGAAPAHCADGKLTEKDWLLNAPDDTERFRLLQQQLRGFDQPMWEVGERFRSLHEALKRRNFELAAYHWMKIGTTVRNGIAKRPEHVVNARKFLLDEVHGQVEADLRKGDYATAVRAFERAKSACIACHHGQDVSWVNDQSLFELKLSAADSKP